MKYTSLLCSIIWVINFIRFLLGHNPSDFMIGSAFLFSSFLFLQTFTLYSIKEGEAN